MPQQINPIEFNNFTRGIITEVSPLTFPDNASIDEQNFVLDRAGFRRRRLGMDYEVGYQQRLLSQEGRVSEINIKTYLWDTQGTFNKKFWVCQIGGVLHWFDFNSTPVSSGFSKEFVIGPADSVLDFTTVDGLLVVVGGENNVDVFELDVFGIIRNTTGSLKIRDLFGVEDKSFSTVENKEIDLREAEGLGVRPDKDTDQITLNHIYNLYNQGWSSTYKAFDGVYGQLVRSALFLFFVQDEKSLPSNSDTPNQHIYPNPEQADDRVVERYNGRAAVVSNNLTGGAANGRFIIDLLKRGESRLKFLEGFEEDFNLDLALKADLLSQALPQDESQSKITVVSSYAGRIFYSGLNSSAVGGDEYSPLLSSYVFFSQLVQSKSDIYKCYQQADPTSVVDSDLVDTDGGFIRIAGAERILSLKQMGNSLVVFATNGVWSIDGGGENGFTAGNFRVNKISDAGIENPECIVLVDSSIIYWAKDGIYALSFNQIGNISAENLSSQTIQSLYNSIPYEQKVKAKGVFDSLDRKVRWLYNNIPDNTNPVKELIFDIDLQAFYKNSIPRASSANVFPASFIETPPFTVGEETDLVVVSGDQVTVLGDDVIISNQQNIGSVREFIYFTVLNAVQVDATAAVLYTFSSYRDSNFLDWFSHDSLGVDAEAYLLTGHTTGGDNQRNKQVPFITTHMLKTEDGYKLNDDMDIIPSGDSSCLMSGRWEWSNSIESGRWTNPQQIYRHSRNYIPNSVVDPFVTGLETVVAKSKLRGKGLSFSLKFETQPGKNCILLGWSTLIGVNDNV